MDLLLQVIAYTVMLGAFYALMSQGLAISFGVLRFPNLSHGGLVVCGAYANWLLSRALDIDGVLTVPLTIALGYPIGWLLAAGLMIPLLRRTQFVQLLVTLGLAIFIEAALILLFTADAARIRSPLNDYILKLPWFNIRGTQILILVTAVVLVGTLAAYVGRSSFGKAMQATAQDVDAAIVVGLPVAGVFRHSFALGTMLCFAAGSIMGIDRAFFPAMGLLLTLKCFVVVVVGGHSRIGGTVVAALALALIEVSIATYVPGIGSGVGVVAGVVLLAVMLWIRPEGLLSKRTERTQVA